MSHPTRGPARSVGIGGQASAGGGRRGDGDFAPMGEDAEGMNANAATSMASTVDWRRVCALVDIPRLGARVLRTETGDIAVFRAEDDTIFALADRCPHKGGPLSQGIVYGHRVACPLHNWSIGLEDGCAIAPDEGCTRSYPVRIDAGVVYLQLATEAPP